MTTLTALGSYNPTLRAICTTAPASILLCPKETLSSSELGITINSADTIDGPPGRAYLTVDGTTHLGQVPDITT